ncbi:hypothetical protein VTN02DRAFT_3439 [Thermoascus thermophilus]
MSINPIVLLLVELGITSIVVGFTAPFSVTRIGALLPVAICVWQCISTAMEDYMIRRCWAGLVAGHAVLSLVGYVDVALLSRWSFQTRGPATAIASSSSSRDVSGKQQQQQQAAKRPGDHDDDDVDGSSWWNRLTFGFLVACSCRHVGTPWQLKNTFRFSNSDPDYVPSRAAFLMQAAFKFLLCYLALDVLTSHSDPEISKKYFSTQKIPVLRRLHEISAEELIVRTSTTIVIGIIAVSIVVVNYSLLAFLAVLFGFGEPRDWPPCFGSIFDAYSVRRFWRMVWHQSFTHRFLSVALFLIHDVCKFPRGTSVARYARFLTVFLISGVVHLLIDTAAGIPLHESGAIQFFCTQVLGILMEELVAGAYCRGCTTCGKRLPPLVERLIGYAWVGAFLVWCVPAYMYPMLYRSTGGLDDTVVPVSVVTMLVG